MSRRRQSLAPELLVLICLASPAGAQSKPAASATTAADTAATDTADSGEIVVTGKPPRGSAIGDIQPEKVLGARDVRATGATNFDDLLEAIAPNLGSARDPAGASPLLLLNGHRVTSYRELRDIPIEAIQRVDILPEEVALKYGVRPDEKVVNLVLRAKFTATTAQVSADTAAGGYSGGFGDVTRLHVEGGERSTVNAHVGGDDILTAAQRSVAQQLSGNDESATATPSKFRLRAGGTINRAIDDDSSATVNVEAEHDVGRSLVNATVPAIPNAGRTATTDSLHAGVAFNRDEGQTNWNFLANADFERIATSDEAADFIVAPVDARSNRGMLEASGTVGTRLLQLPAGPLRATLRLGAAGEQLHVDQAEIGTFAPRTTSRASGVGAINLDLPISRRRSAFDSLGNLTLSGNAEIDQTSDFGTLASVGASANWSPVAPLKFIGSWSREDNAPTVRQLGDPVLATTDTRLFDFANGVLADTAVVTGGNPGLRPQRRDIVRVSAEWLARADPELRLRAEFAQIDTAHPIASLTSSPAFEQAFPTRFVRDSGGALISADLRPVNLDEAHRDTLLLGLDFTKSLKTRRVSASQLGKVIDQARQAGIAVPPPDPQSASSGPAVPNFADHGRLQLSLSDTISLVDKALIAPGLPYLDYLHGAPIGQTGGRPRHLVQAQAGWANNGLGARLGFNWRSQTDVQTAAGRLEFRPLATFDLRMFANVGQDLPLVAKMPFLLGSSVRFEVGNILNSRPHVEDIAGAVPIGYSPDGLDPLGRTVLISFRKQFLPKSYYGDQLRRIEQR